MNKRQLIVAWVVGALISLVFIFSPMAYYIRGERTTYKMAKANSVVSVKAINWDRLAQYCIPIIFIGSLLLYTLRDKKK